MRLQQLYDRAARVPLGRGDHRAHPGRAAAQSRRGARPQVVLRPNHAQVRIRKWWGVHNHIGTVHAIAVANGLEMAMGALAEATVPAHLRWIPKGMTLDYLALSDSTLLATADTDAADWERPGEVPVRVSATRSDGTVVVAGVIRLHTSAREQAGTSAPAATVSAPAG